MKIIEFSAKDACVKGYIQENYDDLVHHKLRPAMIVCPGGAYEFTSPREADPVALEFSGMGYNVFIIDYSVKQSAAGYRPLKELAEAVHTVRSNSGVWNIDPAKVAVIGFSAGGHLAASLGILWNDSEIGLPADCRPDALVLGYPVITTGEYTHGLSSDNVSGGDHVMREKLSLEKRVTSAVPPTFIWHTVDDPTVPVENTLLLINALKRSEVPFEAHLFAHGDHGLSICTVEVETPNPQCHEWVQLCKTWLNDRFEYTP